MSIAKNFFAGQDLPDLDLDHENFLFFKDLIFKKAGISLADIKHDLVKSRLRPHIQKRGLTSFLQYRELLTNAAAADDPEIQKFINLLTTNKTDFFREPKHFDHLINMVIKSWVNNKKKSVSVWCCASSTGEEPYTLSLVLNEHLPAEIPYKILATDIDTQVLAKAKNGVYPIDRIDEIPPNYQDKNIKLGQQKVSGWFKIENHIHNKITFKRHNLNEKTYPEDARGNVDENMDEKYDVIFCRNVLIYFSPATIQTLMAKLHRSLKKDGILFISHSEAIQGCGHLFKTIKPSIFTKV